MNSSNVIKSESDVIYGEDLESISDTDVTKVTYYDGDTIYATTSGYMITKNGENTPITVLSSNKKQYARPENLTSSSLNYQTTTMTVSSAVTYDKPEAYQIERKDGSNKVVLLINPLKQLLSSSPVYIVKEISGTISGTTINSSIDGNIRTISYYNFKTGAESSKDLVVMENVASALNLEEGDIFTYYNDCDTVGVDIDDINCVYVLLRVADVAKNRGSVFEFGSELTKDSENKIAGFRRFGMNTTNEIGKLNYNYTLQLPLWYDDATNKVAFARTNISTSTSTLNTYLAHDEEFAAKLSSIFDNGKEWTKEAIFEAMGSDVTERALSTSTKVFIYDVDAEGTEEEPKLTYKTNLTKDDFADLFSYTVESNKPESADKIAETVKNSVLTYTYFSSYSSNFNMLYIIK